MMRKVSFKGYQICKAIFKVKVIIASDNEAIIFIGLTINKTTCYAGEFPDSFSFK